jgi:hypothetical protein
MERNISMLWLRILLWPGRSRSVRTYSPGWAVFVTTDITRNTEGYQPPQQFKVTHLPNPLSKPKKRKENKESTYVENKERKLCENEGKKKKKKAVRKKNEIKSAPAFFLLTDWW